MNSAPIVAPLERRHAQRLRAIHRSAGWPSHDPVELDLLAGGLLQRCFDEAGRETLRLTDAGIAALAATHRGHRAARTPHEALVARVAERLVLDGRLAWTGLALRAPLPRAGEAAAEGHPEAHGDGATDWVVACPDVFSIRRSSRPDWLEPQVHEIKVRRADLLADVRRPAKHAAYLALASACWYVLGTDARGRPIGGADDVPPACGVLLVGESGAPQVLREAPRRAVPSLPFALWMALAAATPVRAPDEPAQTPLRPADG
jgi:hypothetical protein